MFFPEDQVFLDRLCEHKRKVSDCHRCSGKELQLLERVQPVHTTRNGVGVVGALLKKGKKRGR